MPPADLAAMHCNLAHAVEVLGERWPPLILRDVLIGVRQFDEIQRDLGVSSSVLATRLRRLTERGVIERRPLEGRTGRYEYHLTDKGRAAVPVLLALLAWGDEWEGDPHGPPTRIVHEACGRTTSAVAHCAECGERMRPADVTYHRQGRRRHRGPFPPLGPGAHRGGPMNRAARAALAVVATLGLTLAGCSGGSSSADGSSTTTASSSTTGPGTTTTTDPETAGAWADIERGLAELAPNVGFLAARVAPGGTCEPVHEVAPTTARPTGSQFKLFVLGALAEDIAAGELTWDQTLTVAEDTMSLGNGEGSLQLAEPGTTVTVEDAATKMISISDNTATDMLIGLVGRDDVEAQAERWMVDSSANEPFLTTRQMLLLHYVPDLGDRYLATPRDRRADFLATSVDPLPVTDVGLGYTTEPRDIDAIEWFASPDDVCTAFAGLQELATDPDLAPLRTILSGEARGIGLDPADWPTVWYKGGSEPGVLTLGWLATTRRGDTFVVQAMVSNPDAALAEDALTELAALAHDAFTIVA